MSKLTDKEIDYIVDTYKEVKSIAKTAKITGYSKGAVNNYVKDISKHSKNSRDNKNPVEQIDLNTGELIKIWTKPAHAAKELKINPAEITRVLTGELKQAGGFGWRYTKGNVSSKIEKNILPKEDIEKITLYRWTCPSCKKTNLLEEEKEEIKCLNCNKIFIVK